MCCTHEASKLTNDSGTIIERFQTQLVTMTNAAVTYFFCDHRLQERTTLESFVRHIAKQLVSSSANCLQIANRLHDEQSERTFTTLSYVSLVSSMISQFEEIIIVVDALDEIAVSDRVAITEQLVKFVNGYGIGTEDETPVVKVILTSRKDWHIEKTIGSVAETVDLAKHVDADIEMFLDFQIKERLQSKKLKLRDPSLATRIRNRLVERAGT
jgi:hypothetical protein